MLRALFGCAAVLAATASTAAADPGDLPQPTPPSWIPNPGPLQFTPCTADQVLNAIEAVTPDVWGKLNSERDGKDVIQARNWLTMYLRNQPGDRKVKFTAPAAHVYRPVWINDIGSRMSVITTACDKYPAGGRQR